MEMQQLIQQLKQIVKPEQILTDPEDLYVYSYEKIFEKQNLIPNIVVKTFSSMEIQKIFELAARMGFAAVQRGVTINFLTAKKPLILIDDIPPPKLEKVSRKKGEETEILKDIHDKGHGSPRNLALALKALFGKKNLARCEECKICSGYCTVASSFDGVETWSSKGRILATKAFQSRGFPLSKKIIDVLYTCTECGLCYAQCFENLEVNEAIRATRHQIAEKGVAPRVFTETARNILKFGDPGAVPTERRLSWTQNLALQPSPEKADVLYWVGCTVADRTPNTAKAFVKILNHAKVDFAMLKEKEGCCGYLLLATGFWSEAKEAAKETLSEIEKTGVDTLVTTCAGCYYTFTKLYPEILDVSLPCQIFHSSHYIENLIKNEKLQLKSLNLSVSYHDPCSLGRHSRVFETPRNVLKAIPGLTLTEMPLSKQLGRCCGGGGGLWSFNHQVSMDSAYSRLKDLQPFKVDVLTTACPLCQMNFRYASVKNSVPVKVSDITEMVESALR